MKWDQAITDYKHYLNIERGLSKNTIDSYVNDLKKLILFLKKNELSISPIFIDKEFIQKFIYEVAKKVNQRSQARIISGLRSFF